MDPSLCNSMLMDPLNATDSSQCTHRLSMSLACLTSVCSERLPSCFLWRRHCSLAPDTICLSHSVDSSVLCYTVRTGVLSCDPSASHRTLKALAHVQIWNLRYLCFRAFNKNFQYMVTRKQTDRQTYTCVLQCSHASVGLAQARPNQVRPSLTHGEIHVLDRRLTASMINSNSHRQGLSTTC